MCRGGVGPDGVQLASAAEVAQIPGGDDEHDDGEDGQQRDTEDVAGSEATEVGRHVRSIDAVAAGPRDVDAAVDVQRSEGDHQGGDLREGHECAVDEAEDRAEPDAGDEHENGRDAWEVDEQSPREVGSEAHGRPDRQVDVAGDDDDRLAHRDDHQQGGRQEQIAESVTREQE